MNSTLSGRCVLLVEDEPLLAWDLELALSETGAIVVGPASTLQSALALAQETNLAAAVIDYCLGREEATPLAAFLHERGIPFIIHTGHGTPNNVPWKSAPVVYKPANPDRIVKMLEALVSRKNEELQLLAAQDQSG